MRERPSPVRKFGPTASDQYRWRNAFLQVPSPPRSEAPPRAERAVRCGTQQPHQSGRAPRFRVMGQFEDRLQFPRCGLRAKDPPGDLQTTNSGNCEPCGVTQGLYWSAAILREGDSSSPIHSVCPAPISFTATFGEVLVCCGTSSLSIQHGELLLQTALLRTLPVP